ncbi:unnamed protein product [Linum tenue]|uniref:RING-type domain-containing protein n=1 Tax=Linum tenue TaxID=586396 RepID=A0AAV0N2W3_9ROSI|nr:unnamed protein product [Linum tenue]
MAIAAGLQNVSVLDSSFLRDSQSGSVRNHGNDGRGSTRAVLRMWRELEDEHGVSHGQGRVGERLLQYRGEVLSNLSRGDDVSDGNHSGSDEHEEMRTVSGGESEYGLEEDRSDLGETERERVRQIFREWMSSGARERSTPHGSRRTGSRAEWLGETEQERVRTIREWVQRNNHGPAAGQIEQVLDGLNLHRSEGPPEQQPRRGIRRLCGRQALLDMIKKAEQERQRELQGLLEHRAVTQFPHRNRIQSLLRGRFLRNGRMIENERPRSTAARELGLLRERHSVADLREGLFSRLDRSASGQLATNASDTSSNIEINGYGAEHSGANDLQRAASESPHQTHSSFGESNSCITADDRSTTGSITHQDVVAEGSVHILEDMSEQPSQDVDPSEDEQSSGDNTEEMNRDLQEPTFLPTMENGGRTPGAGEAFSQQSESNEMDYSESSAVDHPNNHARSEEPENLTFESEAPADDWFGNRDDTAEASGEWHEEDGGEFQEDVQSWLEEEEPSSYSQDTAAVGRMDHPFYYTDDDNVYSEEIRELLSRRSVSTLLRSGFRESLDQLIRSYVERQSGNSQLDWELQEETSPSLLEQELAHQHTTVDQNVSRGGRIPNPPPLPPSLPVQRLWDRESQHYHWPQHHEMHPRFGIEWDIINDLRIDMARLQQRMNNMQRMMEACMDMQLELQRSIKQEVSAALNRSPESPGTCENSFAEDPLKWEHVRKGMCCVCKESSIDSLLYRCGHMCTCSKCANALVQTNEKCPMCRAPVIEVIRAYSIS